MNIKLTEIDTNFSLKLGHCWVQARCGIFPDGDAVITAQPLLLHGSDIFCGFSTFKSFDNGETWAAAEESSTLVKAPWTGKVNCTGIGCDGTPSYHKKTGKMLLTGHTVIYENDEILAPPWPRQTFYSVYDKEKGDWLGFKYLKMPHEEDLFFSCGSGCGQRVDLEDGTILIPVYFMSKAQAGTGNMLLSSMVVKCSFDGEELIYLEHGNALTSNVSRGLYEPSIVDFKGEFFMTLRNDIRGYVSKSNDGLNYEEAIPWRFDDGTEIGNYNTQQHWLKLSGKLYLVYTRKGVNNDHVFRHRGPLLMAEVDTSNMCLIKSTEQVLTPNRGARMGNFGVTQVSDDEAWIVVAEWMQNGCENGDRISGTKKCISHGSKNSIFITKTKELI